MEPDEQRLRAAARSVRAEAAARRPPRLAESIASRRRRRAALGALIAVLVLASGAVLAAATAGDRERPGDLVVGGPAATGTAPGTAAPRLTPPGTGAATTLVERTTTSDVPVPTAPPATADATLPPAATEVIDTEVIDLSGPYVATARYELVDPACDQQHHVLAGTADLGQDGTWRYGAEYCATIDAAEVWRGRGPFTLVAPDGATLAGTLVSQAQLPTTGTPYRLEVESGSGRFAGSTGSCLVTLELTEPSPFVQEQRGELACRLTTVRPG